MKINRYIGAFMAGGAISVLCHFITLFYRAAGVSELFVISIMVFTLAVISSIATLSGHYQKLTEFGGMGAMIPLGGLSSAITDVVQTERKKGEGIRRAIWLGVKDSLLILFSGYVAAAAAAAAVYMKG